MRCPVCRSITTLPEISYVDTQPEALDPELDLVKIRGSHSTKVEAVVRQIFQIASKEPEAKCLVFSTVRQTIIYVDLCRW